MNFRKKDFIIYSIAIMLVTAGYYNYLNYDNQSIEASTNVTQNEMHGNLVEEENTQISKENVIENQEDDEQENEIDVGDAVLVSNNETINEDSADEHSNEILEDREELDNNAIDNNYYIETKLERNKMYAEMINKYQDVINNPNASEVQKTIAMQEISKINNNKNAIMICENLILTKEFEECVILINEKNINIVVHTEGGLNTEKVSQIQNIIARELFTEIENIHITEK